MNIFEFKDWLNKKYEFDCFENAIFELALTQTYEMMKGTTINGLPFFQYHQKNLYCKFLSQYLVSLEFLIRRIPQPNADYSIEIDSVLLNPFSDQTEHLRSQLSRLKSLCADE